MKTFNKITSLLVLGIALISFLNSCEITPVEPEKSGDPADLNVIISNLSSGSFDVSWDDIEDASWYYVQVKQGDVLASDFFDGNMAQSENSATIRYTNSDIVAGTEYEITVTASDYLMDGSIVGSGSVSVETPELPTSIIGTWNDSSRGDMIFDADGTFDAPGYNSSDKKTWTISGDELVIITDFTTNLQFETYTYTLTDGGSTLNLENTLTNYSYELTKVE